MLAIECQLVNQYVMVNVRVLLVDNALVQAPPKVAQLPAWFAAMLPVTE